MDTIEVAAGLAFSSLIALLLLMVFSENPQTKQYEKAVESIMIHKGLSSIQEALDSFPELKDIERKLERIAQLKKKIQATTGGPAPNVSRKESVQIRSYDHEIRHLQQIVTEKLIQLITTYVVVEP